MKKCSKALRNRAKAITDKIFEECVRTVYSLGEGDDWNYHFDEAAAGVRMGNYFRGGGPVNTSLWTEEQVNEMTESSRQVGELYLGKLIALPTKSINDIINAHNRPHGYKRAPKTIEALLNELTRRSLFNDTNESDLTNTHGEKRERKADGKKSGKRTHRKRSNATKNRKRKRAK